MKNTKWQGKAEGADFGNLPNLQPGDRLRIEVESKRVGYLARAYNFKS
jgi:hypothetical protein